MLPSAPEPVSACPLLPLHRFHSGCASALLVFFTPVPVAYLLPFLHLLLHLLLLLLHITSSCIIFSVELSLVSELNFVVERCFKRST